MFAPLIALAWIAPAPLQEPRRMLESTYGVKVVEVQEPLAWRGDGYWVRGRAATGEQLSAYQPIFWKEWSLYPPSYVRKAEVHRIVFAAGLSVEGQLRAAVPATDGDTMYYDPELGSYNTHYQRVVVHHEFFHLVDERMGLLYVDPEWAKLNQPDFKYGSGGALMRQAGVGELTDKIPGFLTRYATAGVEEDKAELFAHMVIDGAFVKELASRDPVLTSKIELLRKRLPKFDPAMGQEFWNKVPAWKNQDPMRSIIFSHPSTSGWSAKRKL